MQQIESKNRLPKLPCRRCGAATDNRNGYCDKHQTFAVGWVKRQQGRTTTERGYGATWRKLRAQIIERDKQCMVCKAAGFVGPAQHVDHIVNKAAGGTDHPDNLQAICKRCHDEKTKRERLL